MKTQILKLAALTFFLIIIFTGCKKDNTTAPQATTVKGSIDQTITTGTWRVGSFIENGTDKTTNYTDFGLQFNTSGSISATKPNTAFTGLWSTSNTNDHIQLLLNFVNQGSFSDLTHNWTVTESSDIQIKLAVNENDQSDILILNKNLIK